MLQGKRTRRVVAATLLMVMLTNTIAPLSAYALTSGPTAPEATSFEPVDTTDMVNLQSGDLTYNMPLLEVPGSEGGYPLSLSYHAGIQPKEDASWVGLGWSLNPGAITRNVNGYPDDNENQVYTNRSFWAGGEKKSYSIGVSIGLGGGAAAGFGLSFSQDTYQGFGLGFNASVSIGVTEGNNGAKVGFGISNDGYGNVSPNASLGFSYGDKAESFSAQYGVSTNFESVRVGGSVSISGFEATDIGLVTNGGKASFDGSGGGITAGVYNSREGKISTYSENFGITIPLYYFNVNLGYNYLRYWSDESANVRINGVLYMSGKNANAGADAFDSYSLPDFPDFGMASNPDPTRLQGGALPDFDNYNVVAQGLSGMMRPYLYQGGLAQQVKQDENNDIFVNYLNPSGASGFTHKNPYFRFIGDFSNTFRQNNANISNASPTPSFDSNPIYGIDAFDLNNQRLAGSKHIEFYTNRQIKDESTAKNKGFIDVSNCSGFTRKSTTTIVTTINLPSQTNPVIAPGCTFTILSTSGQTSLFQITCTADVYSNQVGGFSITNEQGVTYHYGLPVYAFNEVTYQKRIDEINGYGFNSLQKSTPYAYEWLLTSITGPDFVDRDNDGKAGNNDWGYWVNFEYGLWSDGYNWRNPEQGYHKDLDNGFQNFSMGKKEVYYLNAIRTKTHTAVFQKSTRMDGAGETDNIFSFTNERYQNLGEFNFTDLKQKVLRLDTIYLFNNSTGTLPGTGANNVYDNIDGLSATNALRLIDFKYNYELCPGTVNSLNSGGKLTLNEVAFKGKAGLRLLPSTKFRYNIDVSNEFITPVQIRVDNYQDGKGIFISPPNNYLVGDLFEFNLNNKTYNGVVTSSGAFDLLYSDQLLSAGTIINVTIKKTKNPVYNKDAYDMWGLFKSDYRKYSTSTNENIERFTSALSSKSTDVWSLRTIKTSLGAEIQMQYESDDYSTVALNQTTDFPMTSVLSYTGTTLQCKLETYGNSISDFLSVGDNIDLIMPKEYSCQGFDVNGNPGFYNTQGILSSENAMACTISSIDNSQGIIFINIQGSLAVPYSTLWPCSLTATPPQPGNIFIKKNGKYNTYGGGIRTKTLSINTLDRKYTTSYSYVNIPSPTKSSGVTTYEPTVFPIPPTNATTNTTYLDALYRKSHYLLSIARLVPPPGVMYQYVTVQNSVKQSDAATEQIIDGKSTYEFEVFNENMISRKILQKEGQVFGTQLKNLSIRNSTARIGNLKRVIGYDNNGNKLTETTNQYLHDEIAGLSADDFYTSYENKLANPNSVGLNVNSQGVIEERYYEWKQSRASAANSFTNQYTMSAYEYFPNISIGSTSINYKTGISTISSTLGFDFYSGAVTKKLDIDGYGNRFVTEMIPAYRKYPSLGLKVNDITRKNMLTQEAANYVYKVDANNAPLGLVSAGVQTWGNDVPALDGTNSDVRIVQNTTTNGNIWRKKSNYSWLPEGKTPDGITAMTSFSDFNWATPSSSVASWKKTGDVTLYDVYSKALEGVDINNNYAATKLGYNNTRVIAGASPARYAELAYSGAEDALIGGKFGGNISPGGGTAVISFLPNPHTGSKSLKVPKATDGFTYTVPVNQLDVTKDYFISAWARTSTSGVVPTAKLFYKNASNTNVFSAVGTASKKAGDWFLLEYIVPASALSGLTNLTVGIRNTSTSTGVADEYYDDFRFAPLNAGVTSYVYDDFSGELTNTLDNNNLYSRYEYDAAGRLIATYRETFGVTAGFIKISDHEYNYQENNFKNVAYNQNFTKQCAAGQIGSVVTYTVPEGKYSSSISQQDADNQAIAEANTNGQAYANTNGTCTNGLAVAISSTGSIVVLFKQNGVNIIGSTFGAGNNTIYVPAAGTYEVQVMQTDNVQRQTTITGQNSIFGTFALFPSVIISSGNTTQITVQ